MLEKLEEQFVDERLQLEKAAYEFRTNRGSSMAPCVAQEEMSKKHAFELLLQGVTTKIAEATSGLLC